MNAHVIEDGQFSRNDPISERIWKLLIAVVSAAVFGLWRYTRYATYVTTIIAIRYPTRAATALLGHAVHSPVKRFREYRPCTHAEHCHDTHTHNHTHTHRHTHIHTHTHTHTHTGSGKHRTQGLNTSTLLLDKVVNVLAVAGGVTTP